MVCGKKTNVETIFSEAIVLKIRIVENWYRIIKVIFELNKMTEAVFEEQYSFTNMSAFNFFGKS